MKMRCIPLLLKHYKETDSVPVLFALGFAAYISFLKPVSKVEDKYYGELNGERYLIEDEQAKTFYKRWAGLTTATLVKEVLSDAAFWGVDLNALPGFREAVVEDLNRIQSLGMKEALQQMQHNNYSAA
jgi:tagaturonate reductase